jgi:hypothetical protein
MRPVVVLVCAAGTLAGCYAYRPATWQALPPGTEIRGLLSTEARVGLEERLHRRFDQIDGRLVERNGDSVLVDVRWLSTTDGRPLYQRVVLSEQDVLRVDVKRLDKLRTVALVAGLVTIAIASVATGFWSTGGDDGGGGGPNEAPPAPDPRGPYR